MRTLSRLTIVLLLAASGGGRALADPFADGVWDFSPGPFAGFGQERLPWIVLGVPQGAGPLEGATDVVALGDGGEITVAFRDNVVVDGPGPDLVIFENAFHVGDEDGPVFTELAFVSVSADRTTWLSFPYDPVTGVGLAGREPVLSNTANGLDPFSPEAGGDRFDLADLGLGYISYVRLLDVNGAIADAGDLVAPANKGGFDLDAVGAIHSLPASRVSGTVTSGGEPVAHARVKLVPSNPGRRLRRRTAPDGTFAFPLVVPSGAYVLKAVRVGIGSAIAEPMIDQGGLALEFDLHLASR